VLFFLPQLLPILPGSLRQRVCNPSLDICESLCHIQNDKHIVLEDGRDLCVAVSTSPEVRLLDVLLAMLKPEVDGRHTWDELVEAGLLPWKLQPLQIIATLWRTLRVLQSASLSWPRLESAGGKYHRDGLDGWLLQGRLRPSALPYRCLFHGQLLRDEGAGLRLS
jgi:hypothetical protein